MKLFPKAIQKAARDSNLSPLQGCFPAGAIGVYLARYIM